MFRNLLELYWKLSRSSYATPSSSQITSEGTGSANSLTRSTGRGEQRQLVQLPFDDLDDVLFELLHAFDRERADELAAQPAVVRWVHADEQARHLRGRFGEGGHARDLEGLVQNADVLAGAEPGVGHDLADGLVAGDDPALVTVREDQRTDRASLAQPGDVARRVEGAGIAVGGQAVRDGNRVTHRISSRGGVCGHHLRPAGHRADTALTPTTRVSCAGCPGCARGGPGRSG
jgi:hypothetical protein